MDNIGAEGYTQREIMYLKGKTKMLKQELDYRGLDSKWGRNKSREMQSLMY